MQTLTIGWARPQEVGEITALDPVARESPERRASIAAAAARGCVYVALRNGRVVGYVVFKHSFFGRGFVSLLMVDREYRRRGVATALMRHAERVCASDRIFTSTNASNTAMQRLLARLGYQRSGEIDDLDVDDPEIYYSRQCDAGGRRGRLSR